MTKLQTFKPINKAEALKSLATTIKLLKTLMHATGNLINNSFMIDRYKYTTINIAAIWIMQFHYNIPRTVLKMSDYSVATCISVGYFILYTVIIVKLFLTMKQSYFFLF